MERLVRSFVLLLTALGGVPVVFAQTQAPRFVEHEGRHALLVDDSPFLVLGAQINNSSSWPGVLPQVWPALELMHVNTAEAPVYWEQIEPKRGSFDWTSVDALLEGARAHHLHLILLWFGTWKNGNDHYVPEWVKQDPQQYRPMVNMFGNPLDVLSANEPANMNADRTAFAALMRHLAEQDAAQHTVLMIQVENESGAVGAIRDYSAAANREFAGEVPAALLKSLGKRAGTWGEVFGGDADEVFQAWSQARYINEIAEAGKKQFNIPMYCNVWLAYPPAQLPERQIPTAGIDYPSGGPVQSRIALWKLAAPSIDAIGPDIYSSNPQFYLNILDTYNRRDNPLWIPETGREEAYGPYFFAALGRGAVGFSPFGVDWTGWGLSQGQVPKLHAQNYALLGPMDRTVAALNFEGKVHTAVEVSGGAEQQILLAKDGDKMTPEPPVEQANATVPFNQAGTAQTRAADAAGAWIAEVRFGSPRRDGEPAPGTANATGRMMVAQLGPNEFLLTGLGGSVRFRRPGLLPGIGMQILRAEQGYFTPATTPGGAEVWHRTRLLNGDQTDRGIQFPDDGKVDDVPLPVRITVGRLP